MVLKVWGNSSRPWKVTFFFRFGSVMCSVENYLIAREDVADLLRRYRKARYWFHNYQYSKSSIIPVPRFGLRWLCWHWCVVVIESRYGHRFATAIPRGLRPTKVPFLRWFARPFRDNFTTEELEFIL